LAAAFSQDRAPPHRRHGFAATKIRAIRFAASLPQDLSPQLMFELAGFGRRGLSRSLDLEFLRPTRGSRATHRRACGASASSYAGFRALLALPDPPHSSSVSSVTLFRAVRAQHRRALPSVCRNAPEVCRMTRRFKLKCAATFRAIRVKPFN
jgi:hypothetical protein